MDEASATMTLAALFEDYPATSTYYDELMHKHGVPRSQYQALYDFIASLPPGELEHRKQATDLAFLHQGITFTVYDDDQGTERTFPFDLLPRIITAAEWKTIDRGLAQRIT